MKITFNRDARNIKAGTIFDFSSVLDVMNYITLVGDNGSGKSTILQSIRGIINSKPTRSMYEDEYKLLAIEGDVQLDHNFEKVFFFDAVKDNGSDMMNAYDAVSYIKMGGFGKKNLSHGQGSLVDIGRFVEEHKDLIIPKKTLLVFDEIDTGFSMSNMAKFINFILNTIKKYECKIMIVSHNPFFIDQSYLVFDVEANKIKKSREYIKEKTGYTMSEGNKNENESNNIH